MPGCGVRLITNNAVPVQTKPLHPNAKTTIPFMSVPATTMTTEDFYPSINIFTQFGDLSPSQMLTLFHQFHNWPEYQDSPFVSAMESSFMKMEQSAEQNVEGITEEDDVSAEDSEKKL
jgi:dimethyladenosine transferase 2, mitochondrial